MVRSAPCYRLTVGIGKPSYWRQKGIAGEAGKRATVRGSNLQRRSQGFRELLGQPKLIGFLAPHGNTEQLTRCASSSAEFPHETCH
jgi:hypothetical protein